MFLNIHSLNLQARPLLNVTLNAAKDARKKQGHQAAASPGQKASRSLLAKLR